MKLAPLVALALVLSGCGDCGAAEAPTAETAPATTPSPDPPVFAGRYRAVLASEGGELPFFLTIGEPGADPPAEAHNGEERVAFTSATIDGSTIRLEIAEYGAVIEATLEEEADGALRGEWRRENREGESMLPFSAAPIPPDTPRFAESIDEPGAETIDDVSGTWRVVFTDEDGDFVARGELQQEGSRVTGTFITATGDYRYLAGDFQHGVLRLSTFNGSFAYLFVARADDEGALSGDFWSRDTYHATFEARRHEGEEEILPDPFGEVRVVSADQKLRFDLETVDGERVALPSPELDGRVVIVSIFGSWCPNCTDEAPVLAQLHSRYGDRGLSIVGLAFEHRRDPDVALPRLSRFVERHGIEFPVALAGRSVKSDVAAVLPDISELQSYPTTIFVGRDGRVRRIHSGFAGPATGVHHERLVEELEALVETLLSEGDSE